MIPSAKILALAYLLITAQRGSIKNNEQRIRLYRMVEFIGRWSMVDVFVDTFTAALIQLQPLMSVEPGPGLFFFAAVVVFTMLAVECFDPRLVWVIPVLAAAVGAWVAVTRIMGEGPKITIVFKTAEGLEAGKTKIHFNGV